VFVDNKYDTLVDSVSFYPKYQYSYNSYPQPTLKRFLVNFILDRITQILYDAYIVIYKQVTFTHDCQLGNRSVSG
jgi:hypothetical protein